MIDFSDYNFSLGTAESLTGGAIAKAISSVSGSSRYFKGGIVAYSTDVKISVLNVKTSTIEKHGVVLGAVMTAKRLFRCRPFGTKGYDPVP